MIGHIEHGSNFGGLFRYLLATDKGARIIGGNAAGETIEQLTQEFNNDYQAGKQAHPPEIPISIKLQGAIDAASKDQPTMTIFIGRLQHLGIDVMPIITETGRKRISYHMNGAQPFRGSKIHDGSFPKLISHRGIDFD